ncbi:MAG: DUF3667 domain-containing protein [Pseudomonadota bacterium]
MRSPQLARFIRSTQRQKNSPCSNCATIYSGNYCPECGQESFTGAPTAIDFIYEFLTRNIFERGKMPRTIWHLLRYPGGLTVDFLEGRRQRFIRPVRLYFGLSVLYFLLLSLSTNLSGKIGGQIIGISPETSGISSDPAKAKTGKTFITIQRKEASSNTATPEENAKVEAPIIENLFGHSAVTALEKRINRFKNVPQEEQFQTAVQALFNQAPKAMFFLVPVFAFLLKTMFLLRRIPYGAHLLFAFHYHAFLFLCLSFMLLPLPDPIPAVLILVMSGYLFQAIRTTYACSRLGTLWRWIILNIVYPITIITTLALATLTAVFFA